MMKIQVRNDSVQISGYVNAVDRFSRPIKDKNGKYFVEKISPGAFQRAIDEAGRVDVMLNHERVLTDTDDIEVSLHEDSIGLYFDGIITDPEVVSEARAKKLVGWSFGFIPTDKTDTESRRTGIAYERQVDSMQLREVSIIDERKIPCYEGTSIQVRAEDTEVEYIEEQEPENGAQDPENEAQDPENGAEDPSVGSQTSSVSGENPSGEEAQEQERKCRQERALLELRKRRLDLKRG